MKNIIKFLFATICVAIVAISCKDEADRDWTSQEASFKLFDTTLGSNVLYESMKDNPISFAWQSIGAGEYSVVVSSSTDFANKVVLGKSTSSNYSTTIGAFNTLLLQSNYSPYTSKTVYVRVEKGNEVSNSISFEVTVYPTSGPVVTSPTAGATFVLEAANQANQLPAMTWNDYTSYGVDVDYVVEIAQKGSASYQELGAVKNEKSLTVTVQTLNAAVLKTGAQAGVATDIDVRVSASTKSTGGTIKLVSAPVSIKVTPFANNVTLYLIGDATAGNWDNAASNINMYPLLGNHSNSTLYSYTGYFKAGGFKLIKDKGNWDNQYGAGADAGTLSTSGGSGNINVASAGYYTLSVNVSNLTYTLTPTTAGSTFGTIGIIGSATANGWDSSTAMTQSTFDSHVWYLAGVTLANGEMKFRANNGWDDNWGSNTEDFGTGTPGGANIPVKAGTYNIYFNDMSGAYVLIKQ